jgi:hypothetical protein
MVVKVRKGVNSKKRTSVVEQGVPVAGEENQLPNVPSTAPAVNKQKVQQNDTPPATQEDPNEILEEVYFNRFSLSFFLGFRSSMLKTSLTRRSSMASSTTRLNGWATTTQMMTLGNRLVFANICK